MTQIYTRKDTDTLKLTEEFEEHYNVRIQANPGVDRQVVFEDWADQKASALQQEIFKLYVQLDK